MRLLKKCSALLLVGALIFGISCTTLAAVDEKAAYRAKMSEIGVPAEIVDTMSVSDIEEMILYYDAAPEKVSVSTQYLEVNTAESIYQYVNASEDEKYAMQMSDDEIARMDQKVEKLSDMSDRALRRELEISQDEVEQYRRALEPDPNYMPGVTPFAQGAISPSKMTISVVVYDLSNANDSNYQVSINYAWSQPYFMDIFKDKITVAWGGNLYLNLISAHVNFHKNNLTSWGSFVKTEKPLYVELAPNSASYYQIEQLDGVGYSMNGIMKFQLKQNGKENKYTKLIVQYCHQTMAFGAGLGVSATGPIVTINPGTGYDTSPQVQKQLIY